MVAGCHRSSLKLLNDEASTDRESNLANPSLIPSMDTFRVRLNCIDHYQAVPTEFDPPVPVISASVNAKERPKLSVIRVFGATQTGQKVLMHIHGAFQYTYIEYSGSLVAEDVNLAIRTLQLSIDHALAVSYRKNAYDGKSAYVAHISLVKGIPFYGFHVGYRYYLKIYLLNPLHMTRLADLLREGAVLKRALQPYESHMQYLAQWMCDYNLYGCGYIDCEKAKFREPVPRYLDLNNILHRWHDRSIPSYSISDANVLEKQSHCALEVDVCVEDILNRRGVEGREIHHDFIERIHPLPSDMKLVQSMAGLWKDETRRRKARMGLVDPNSSPFPPEVLITMSAEARNSQPGGWIHEDEYREKVADLAAKEHEESDKRALSFSSFVKPAALDAIVQTALESIEDLYPKSLPRARANATAQSKVSMGGSVTDGQILVDESRILEVGKDHLSDQDETLSKEKRIVVDGAQSGKSNGQSQSSNEETEAEVPRKVPIKQADFEKLGVRKAGDYSHLEEDVFEIPDQDTIEPITPGTKKKRVRVNSGQVSMKKQKLVKDAAESMPDFVASGSESGSEQDVEVSQKMPFYSNAASNVNIVSNGNVSISKLASNGSVFVHGKTPKPSGSPLKSTLSFPIVKDPNDPNTVLRLSQQSSSPLKASQGQSPKPLQPGSINVTTPLNAKNINSLTTPTSAATVSTSVSSHWPLLKLKGIRKPSDRNQILVLQQRSPSAAEIMATMSKAGLPDVIYQDAYYSNEEDVPDRQREYAGREFKLGSNTVPYLPDFDSTGESSATFGQKLPILIDQAAEEYTDSKRRRRCRIKHWSIADAPPSKAGVLSWLEQEHNDRKSSARNGSRRIAGEILSQIDGPTQKNKHGFKYSQKQASTSVQHETQYMSLMSMEVHVNTRGHLAPNPEEDEIACIFWCVQSDDDDLVSNHSEDGMHMGILALAQDTGLAQRISRNMAIKVEEEETELDVLTKMVDIVRYYDPDILTGYEVHNSSWGYLIERACLKYEFNLCDEFSRMTSQSHGRFGKDDDRWGFNHTSTIRVTGRHTINIWRAMRGELNLLQYTMENVVFHLLHRRIPHYSFLDLTKWYKSKNPRDLAKVIEYFVSRVQIDLEILESNELVPRTSEQARLLGVDWFSVISRGSQFKVESLMFRIAKPENFILVSPSRRQVGGQNALECLPLIMEPQSDFYTSPMLVLDFQSLYPSVMIAYNYCYSTFLGRVVSWRGTNKMGFTDYHREQGLLELLKDHINIAPNGIMYARTHVRKSLLAKMLSEILETRVMVKSGMKIDKSDKTLQRLLNNRQLALKLIANVTYGYTSASFSGRMPCSEIADSIVQTGRETLEKAIALIHSVERWGAEVVYGDTDSLFVYLKGRTRLQAFDIGEEITATITKMNPRPVRLKFEKVYHPCVLLAKKRYVGFKYENRHQKEPEFEAKGIETVRRDGTPAEQKIEENALKILFRTSDLSQVKSFFQSQCAKIVRGKVSIQDFCYAKEVKLGTYSEKGPPPPGALISARRMLEDPRLEPQYGERVPYVVITGGPGARLIDRCVAPDILLQDAHLELDAEYYISKNLIPPLERIFNLVGANVRQWYDEMPKYQRIRQVEAPAISEGENAGLTKKILESYMKSSTCLVCRELLDSDSPICNSCYDQAPQSLLLLQAKLAKAERKASQLAKVCRSCSGFSWKEDIRCDSKDCPVFYSRTRQAADLSSAKTQIEPVVRVLEMKEDDDLAW